MNLKPTLLSFILCACLYAQKKERPNILFIIADDLTATAVSSYENKNCQTPNIDKLASKGIELFDMINDPKQYTNLANDPKYKSTVTFFKSKLKQKLAQIRTNDLEITYD